MSKKKKIIILTSMVLLLAVTAVLNFVLSGKTAQADGPVVSASTQFSQYKTERNSSRAEQLVLLDETIQASGEDEEVRANALQMKLRIAEIMEKELFYEQLIEAKGYPEAVVSIGLTSGKINVIVKDDDFDQDDAIIIYSILAEEADATPDVVRIIPVS